MVDVFREVRERVSAQDAARHYGIELDRRGWCKCPFHNDHHASMSFKGGRFRCWSCNASGDSIDFTARLLGLEPVAAIEKLDADFCLNLPLHRQQTPAERREAQKAAQHRREVCQTYELFEEWRSGLTRQLCECFRLAHEALKGLETPADMDKLTDDQMIAIQRQPYFEYLSNVLTGGEMSDIMTVFRERGRIGQLCEKILNGTQTKSGAA